MEWLRNFGLENTSPKLVLTRCNDLNPSKIRSNQEHNENTSNEKFTKKTSSKKQLLPYDIRSSDSDDNSIDIQNETNSSHGNASKHQTDKSVSATFQSENLPVCPTEDSTDSDSSLEYVLDSDVSDSSISSSNGRDLATETTKDDIQSNPQRVMNKENNYFESDSDEFDEVDDGGYSSLLNIRDISPEVEPPDTYASQAVISNGVDPIKNCSQNNGFIEHNVETDSFNRNAFAHSPQSSTDNDEPDVTEMHRLLTTDMWDKLNKKDAENTPVQNVHENRNFYPTTQKIFGKVCSDFLKGTCFRTQCACMHRLPNIDAVQSNLESASIDDVNGAFEEQLLEHEQLLVKYFAVFCSYYGRRMKREQLRRLISVAAKEAYIEHNLLKAVVNGFVLSGVPYSIAMDIVMDEINESNIASTDAAQFELMLAIFTDENNTYADERDTDQTVLMRHLKYFQSQIIADSFVLSYKAIDKMLQLEQLIDDQEARKYFLEEVLGKCSINTFRQIDKSLLNKYLKQIEVFGVHHVNRIRQKGKTAGMVFY